MVVGAQPLVPPLCSGRSRFVGARRDLVARNRGQNAQTPKRARSRGSFLSGSPAARAQGRAEALAQEPETNLRRALGPRAGLGRLGERGCVCSAPRSSAEICSVWCIFFFFLKK